MNSEMTENRESYVQVVKKTIKFQGVRTGWR